MRRPGWWTAVALLIALGALWLGCGDDDDGELGQSAFDAAFDDLGEMIERARKGDLDAAEQSFRGMHNFTHLLDSEMRVRGADDALRRDTFDAVLAIEGNLGGARDAARLASEGERLAELLRRAAAGFGYKAPGP